MQKSSKFEEISKINNYSLVPQIDHPAALRFGDAFVIGEEACVAACGDTTMQITLAKNRQSNYLDCGKSSHDCGRPKTVSDE